MESDRLQEKLKESNTKVSKLREAVVALRARSSEVEALCVTQRQQLEDLKQQHKERELELLRRCQDSEQRTKALESELVAVRRDLQSQGGQVLANKTSREPTGNSSEERHVGLSRRSQVPSAGLQNDQAGSVIHSAVSLCEGALGMLKAALAANKGPADELEHHVGSQHGRHPSALQHAGGLHDQDAEALRKAAGDIINRTHEMRTEGHDMGLPSSSLDKQSALEIVHVWLGYLLQGKPDKDRISNVARHLVHELRTRQGSLAQSIVGGVLSELMECSKNQADMLSSVPYEYDEADSGRQQGGQPLLGLTGNTAIEDFSFTRLWYSEHHRQKATLTTLMMCMLRIQQMQYRILEILQSQLSQALIAWLMGDTSSHNTTGCVIASALVLAHRYQGNAEAVRVLVLDLLLACRICSWHAAVPVLTAALTSWPNVLCTEQAPADAVVAEISHTIQAVCRCILEESPAEENDENATLEGSMSCTTTTAATPKLLCHSAQHLQQLGMKFWGWQETQSLSRHKQLAGPGTTAPLDADTTAKLPALKTLTHSRAPLDQEFRPSLIAALRESIQWQQA